MNGKIENPRKDYVIISKATYAIMYLVILDKRKCDKVAFLIRDISCFPAFHDSRTTLWILPIFHESI